MTGLYGHIYSADIHVSTMVPKNSVYVLAPAYFVVLCQSDKTSLFFLQTIQRDLDSDGVVYEELGFALINDYAVSRITVS